MSEPQPQQPLPPGNAHGASVEPRKKGGFWRFVWRHPSLSGLVLILFLLVVFVLQNMEPTTIDFLFWEIANQPKLVLILMGVPLGALGWELFRRAFR